MALCRSCGAQIDWVETKNGKKMPVDKEMVNLCHCEPGDMVVDVDGNCYRYNPERHIVDEDVYISHFATCPEADDWRKKKCTKD